MTEQHKFKVGDVVECTCEQGEGGIHLGERYTVKEVRGEELFVGTKFDGWYQTRFRLVSPSPSQPASQWVYRTVLKAWCGPDCPHYRDGRHMVAPDCVCGCGLTYTQAVERGHIPRDSAEAPKELPMPAWEKAVRGWEPMDPYTAHRLSRSDATARELTDARVGNVAARARIAAMTAWFDVPAEERLKHPMTYWSGRNGGRRRG